MSTEPTLQPLHDFAIINYIDVSIVGMDISISNAVVWMWVTVIVVFILLRIASQQQALIPQAMQLIAESIYQLIQSMVMDMIGEKGRKYIPFVFTLFVFILGCNLIGLLPGSFTPTSQLVITATLAISVFIYTVALRVAKDGFGFFKAFAPSGLPKILLPFMIPIEILSFLARPVSMALRLFANMTAGHTVLTVVAFFGLGLPWFVAWLPLGFSVLLYALEIFIAFIQAYIFAILTCVYIDDALADY